MAVTTVNSSTTSGLLLAPNSARKGLVITNDDANALYVLLDSGTASATNYSVKLDEGEDMAIGLYLGEVNGVWAVDGTGAARITEF